jgi:hypothetical protein
MSFVRYLTLRKLKLQMKYSFSIGVASTIFVTILTAGFGVVLAPPDPGKAPHFFRA